MSLYKFKAGDRVRCIDAQLFNGLKKDDIHTVESYEGAGAPPYILTLKPNASLRGTHRFFERRFELAKEETPAVSKAFETLELISQRGSEGSRQLSPHSGKIVTVITRVANNYEHEKLPTIPAGTEIKFDFGGDFGFYGVADINGVLHKVRIELDELHKIDFSNLR